MGRDWSWLEKVGTYEEINGELKCCYGEELVPMDFYRGMYSIGSFERPGSTGTVVLTASSSSRLPSRRPGDGRIRQANQWTVTDGLDQIRVFVDMEQLGFMATISYSGRKCDLNDTYTLYGLAFDLDEPDVGELCG